MQANRKETDRGIEADADAETNTDTGTDTDAETGAGTDAEMDADTDANANKLINFSEIPAFSGFEGPGDMTIFSGFSFIAESITSFKKRDLQSGIIIVNDLLILINVIKQNYYKRNNNKYI